MRPIAWLGTVVVACGAVAARGHEGPRCDRCGRTWTLHGERPAPEPGPPRAIPHSHERAGWPSELGSHLEPTITPGGIGYYVGGSVPAFGRGHGRRPTDGTWGWDETGHPWKRRRVILGWAHGRLFQGGTGRYATDGPHVPDPIAGLASRLRSKHQAE
ncbi:MAG: hypothetical protein KatS3mg108_0812 [Isosphaeraceae bacterium]|jgi:hypothetical protein|nr:MAG: hypothetical protein KatS3mg108_0812 [Isosphaeraceae bacterium]